MAIVPHDGNGGPPDALVPAQLSAAERGKASAEKLTEVDGMDHGPFYLTGKTPPLRQPARHGGPCSHSAQCDSADR